MRTLWIGSCLLLAGCESVGLGGGGLEASFSGPYSESYNYQNPTGLPALSCVVTYDLVGTVHLDLKESMASGESPGSTEMDWTMTLKDRKGNGCGNEGNAGSFGRGGDLTGMLDGFHFADENKSSGSYVVTTRVEVGGQRVGDGATGFVTLARTGVTGTTGVDLESAAHWNVTWK